MNPLIRDKAQEKERIAEEERIKEQKEAEQMKRDFFEPTE